MSHLKPVTVLGDYIHGHFSLPKEPDGKLHSVNPGNVEDEIGHFPYAYNHVYEAIESAHLASAKWAGLSLEERASYFKRLYAELESHQDYIAEIISREVGKPLWESRQEAKGLLGKISITLKESLELISEKNVPDAQPGILGKYRFKPKGVMLVLGPFNFPAHLPHGHIVPALLTGNTFIFKPSEKTPATGQMMAEMFHRSGFPPGVFNLVQGEREVGKRLALGNVDGVLFTGSYDVGLKIKKETISHFWKTLALEMGGKNASIITDDCDLEKALFENLMGAFQTTGQRCSATSRIIVFESMLDRFLKRFHEAAKAFKIGYAFEDPQPFMGPLISQDAMENYLRFRGIAEREGGELVMRGKALERSP